MGSALAGKIIKSPFGWESTFYIFGLLVSLWGVILLLFLHDSPLTHPTISINELGLYKNSIGESKGEGVKTINVIVNFFEVI